MISPLLFSGADKLQRWPYDVAAAKQLMAEAGYPDGLRAGHGLPQRPLRQRRGDLPGRDRHAGPHRREGDPERAAQGQYFEKVSPRKYDSSFNLLGWTPGSLDSWNVLANLVICRDASGKGGTFNFGGYCNPKIDELDQKNAGRAGHGQARRADRRRLLASCTKMPA